MTDLIDALAAVIVVFYVIAVGVVFVYAGVTLMFGRRAK